MVRRLEQFMALVARRGQMVHEILCVTCATAERWRVMRARGTRMKAARDEGEGVGRGGNSRVRVV